MAVLVCASVGRRKDWAHKCYDQKESRHEEFAFQLMGSYYLAPAGMYRAYAVALSSSNRPLAQGHHKSSEHFGNMPMLQDDRRQWMQVHQRAQHLRVDIYEAVSVRTSCLVQKGKHT